MSRGLGLLQNVLMAKIRHHGKPMTFADIRAAAITDIRAARSDEDNLRLNAITASFERSLRRALRRLVVNGFLVAMGEGGRGEPHRYFIHPLLIGMMGSTPEADVLAKALYADPGASAAAAKHMKF